MSTRNAGRSAQVEAAQRVRKESSEGHSMSTRKRPGELAACTSPARRPVASIDLFVLALSVSLASYSL